MSALNITRSGALIFFGLALPWASGTEAKTKEDLSNILKEIEAMKQSYESRIAALERQKVADAQRIEALERRLSIRSVDTDASLSSLGNAPSPQGKLSPLEGSNPAASSRQYPQARSRELTGNGAADSSGAPDWGLNDHLKYENPDGDIPFAMRTNLSLEGRYSYFGRTADWWQPNNTLPESINNYSVIELNRAMLGFSGYALLHELVYNLILFGSTSAGSLMPVGYLGYDWMPEVKGRIGVWKAPGTREWFEPYTESLGADRTMATTYFRPNWTPGAWLEGLLRNGFSYQAFVGNAFGGSSSNYQANRLGTGMLYALNGSWEPWGDMGFGISDLGWHEQPVIRLGGSGVYQDIRDSADQGSSSNPDSTIFRVSNGTPLGAAGALGVDSVIHSASVYLATFDSSLKYQGFSIYTEFIYRYLGDFGYSGAAPSVSSLNDFGGILQGSYFLIPKSLEIFARTSLVSGLYGTPWEAGGGWNWYPLAMVPNWIMTAEALYINGSPADNLPTPYRAGEKGVVGQVQVKLAF